MDSSSSLDEKEWASKKKPAPASHSTYNSVEVNFIDPSLLKQSQLFTKHATRVPVVQQRSDTSAGSSHSIYNAETAKKKKKPSSSHSNIKSNPNIPDFDYKTASSNQNDGNNSAMKKIVDYMKKRHLESKHWPLTLDEILDETQVFDMSAKVKHLLNEALPRNSSLECKKGNKYIYSPPYKIKGKSSLVQVAKKHHEDAKGGILLTQLNECIPQADKVLESMSNEIIVVPTQVNKRKDKVFFWNDSNHDFELDEEFRTLWRNVHVDHLDEKKIEEYLQKQGIDSMKDLAPQKFNGPPKRKSPKKRNNAKVHNEHLNDVLEDYQ